MAVKLGNGNWAVKEDKLLAYNDNSGLFFNKEFDFSRGTSATYVGRDGLIKTAGIQPNIVNNGDFSELGSELVTNGDFSQSGTPSSSSYTLGWYSPDSGVSISNGELSLTKQSSLCRAYATDGISSISVLTIGKTYKLVYTVTENNQGSTLRYYNGTYININGSVGTHTLYYKAATQFFILLSASENKTIKLDNVSIKQVDPNDYWTLGTGWKFGDNRATSNASSNSYLNQQTYEIGKTYKLGFEVLEGTIELRSAQYSKGTGFYTTGTYSIEVIPTTISTHFYVYTGFGQSSITNITVQEIQTDTPRIDFTNDTKGHLLLEPSRTNLFPYSEDFSTWNKVSNAVVTDNFTTSPDGTQNASKFTFDGTTNGRVEKPLTVTSGTQYTFSIWLKNDNLSDPTQVWLAFSTLLQGEYVTVTNEWQRFTTTQTADGTTEYPRIQTSEVGSIFAWGAQFEEGSYATSYIPTTGAASTRNADVCNNSGSAQDFNSEEGVLYWEAAALNDDAGSTRTLSISDGTNSNTLYTGYNSTSNVVQAQLVVGGVAQTNMLHTVSDRTDFLKVAVLYQNNNHKMYINGIEVSVDTSGSVPSANTFDRLNFDLGQSSFDFYGKVRNVQVFTEALTDEQLEKLTS